MTDMDSPDNGVSVTSALACFHGKIKEAISLVRSMSTEDKLKAVQYWNVVSENLQDVVNSSADDISALQSQLSERENMMLLQHARTPPAGSIGPHQQANSQGFTVIRRTEPSNVDVLDFGHKQTGVRVIGPDLIDHYLATQPPVGSTSDGHLALSVVVDGYGNFTPCEVLDDPLRGPVVTNANSVDVPISAAPERIVPCAGGTESGERSGSSQNADLRRYLSFAKSERDNVVLNFFTKQPRSPGSKGEGSHVYCCNVCQNVYSSVAAFYSHFAVRGDQLMCCKCGQSCFSKSLFRNHMLTHSKTLLKCIECERDFTTQSNLNRHVRTHTGDRRHECAVCHKRFIERKDLRIHSRLHSGERPYQCSVCPARFVQLSAITAHLASHAGVKPHLCDLCGKTFRQMASLRQHKRRHEGKKCFACDRCPMAFIESSDLKRHLRSHLPDKPYKCDQCDKSFPRQLALSEHLNRHYGNKPYRCPICTKGYADMSACKKHIKTHARDESRPPSPSLPAPNPDLPSVILPVSNRA